MSTKELPTKSSKIVPQKKGNSKIFRIGVLLPLTKKYNSDFFLKAIDALCELGFEVKVLGEGDLSAQKKCFESAEKYPKNFEIMESLAKNKEKILSSSDIILFPVFPEKKYLMEIKERGIVPVIPKNEFFDDFDPQSESGCAFTFEKDNFWQFLTAIIRASENFKFPYDWKNIKENLKEVIL